MYTVKINVGKEPEVLNVKSFAFDKVAEEIGCDYIEPVNIYLGNNHYVILCDEEGSYKKNFTYTGFRGGFNPLTGDVRVQPFINSFLICKTRKYKGTLRYTGLNDNDMEILSNRIMIVSDPGRGQFNDQVFMNFTSLSNEDLTKEMEGN